jgi:hypothetical protein
MYNEATHSNAIEESLRREPTLINLEILRVTDGPGASPEAE